MVDYTIAAIPTVYRGVRYRSRLEARWAAFFDQLGWNHTYEPYDLGLWSPDFIIKIAGEYTNAILVEVKPIGEFCADTIDRMISACIERGIFPRGDESNIAGIMLVGTAPRSCAENNIVELGWFTSSRIQEYAAKAVGAAWFMTEDRPVLVADVVHTDGEGYFAVMTDKDGLVVSRPLPHWRGYHDHAMQLWANACNAVQWRPTRDAGDV